MTDKSLLLQKGKGLKSVKGLATINAGAIGSTEMVDSIERLKLQAFLESTAIQGGYLQ